EAFETVKVEIEAGRRSLPTYVKGKQRKFASTEFLAQLGAPNITSVPPTLRKQIRDLARAQGLQGIGQDPTNEREQLPTENRVANFLSPIVALHTFASK